MSHNEIHARSDVAAAPVALEDQLGAPQEQGRLRRVLLGSKLLKFSVKLLGNAQIHSHTPWYQTSTAVSGTAALGPAPTVPEHYSVGPTV